MEGAKIMKREKSHLLIIGILSFSSLFVLTGCAACRASGCVVGKAFSCSSNFIQACTDCLCGNGCNFVTFCEGVGDGTGSNK